MRPLILPLLAAFFPCLPAARSGLPLDCAGSRDDRIQACQEPLDTITTVAPGEYYVAKLPCLDCPVARTPPGKPWEKHSITHDENDLYLNVSISPDRAALLLGLEPIFPVHTNPFPYFYVYQVSPDFSRANLDESRACTLRGCDRRTADANWCGCVDPTLGSLKLDFDLYQHTIRSSSKPGIGVTTWGITFDAIGGHSGYQGDPTWVFNHSDQKMLKVIFTGEVHEQEPYSDPQTSSSLFGPVIREQPPKYTLHNITSVELVPRTHVFAPKPALGFWAKIAYFFGKEPKVEDGHVVYLDEEWGDYGRKGTLKNAWGIFIYDWPWDVVGIIIASVAGALVLIYIFYRLGQLILRQRELARWHGMDAVWAEIRRDRGDDDEEEEEEGLLGAEERYTDRTPRPTLEIERNKPLPSKPLPEKPLPDIPLVEDL
ncbi:hypothetical protein CC78DRAFT_619421 [Lojkania enalia]|uniref:Uncharacterized protein n=1 Tax=Lojkania enalia TaxID=147567 RepID=A0A9P4K3Z7_9PLEO|nr:hypothetical protein CC78DRAFT_619421 [Didymosphaeria enalia]